MLSKAITRIKGEMPNVYKANFKFLVFVMLYLMML